jgi:hypothetical protein
VSCIGEARAARWPPSLGRTSTTARCQLGHFDAAGGDFADWSEFDKEAERLSIEVRAISREELTVLIEGSTLEIPTTEHRTLHLGSMTVKRQGIRWKSGCQPHGKAPSTKCAQ